MSKVVDYIWKKRENTLLFAVSLLISLILFMQLGISPIADAERELVVPLEFTNKSDQITVLQARRTIKVLASGPQQVIDNLDTSNISAFIDLAGAPVGRERYPVEVTGPVRADLTLTAVQSFEQIEIEATITERFDVTVVTIDVPPEAYTYEGATSYPQSVEVSGPESIMKDVRTVRALLNLSNVVPNRTYELDLEILGEGGKPVPVVQADPEKVMVSPAVSIGPTMRRLFVNPVFVNQLAQGFRVSDYTVTPNQIEATGGSGDLSRYTTVDTRPIDIGGLRQSYDFEVEVILPDGLTAEGGTTVTVHVEVRRN